MKSWVPHLVVLRVPLKSSRLAVTAVAGVSFRNREAWMLTTLPALLPTLQW